jgi:hypothetical protein
MLWIVGGLDVKYDQEFRDQLRNARHAGKPEELIDHHNYLWGRSANMDW